jgi:ribosomal-protein-alanine N-acetyltransferase
LNHPSQPSAGGSLRLVPLPVGALQALLRDDLETASVIAGARLTPYFVEHRWLWELRIAQLVRDPGAAGWIARAAVDEDVVVGHVGFHGPPDERGMVEVAYSVDPQFRRRGYARKMLHAALRWARQDPGVATVRATVTPDNVGSIATLGAFPFERVGQQRDDVDGVELVYELPVLAGGETPTPSTDWS